MKKLAKTVIKILKVVFAVIGVFFIIYFILFFYFMANPQKAEKFGNAFFTQQFVILCRQEPQAKQNRCFALAADTMENPAICDDAPNKDECVNLIGKVDPSEFKNKK